MHAMRHASCLVRLLHVCLMLTLILGVVARPPLFQLAELHADQHRSLAMHAAIDEAAGPSHQAHDDGSARHVDPQTPRPHHDDGGSLHALMHMCWAGGTIGYLVPHLASAAVKLAASHPWRPLPAAAMAARLANPFRPPIA